MSDDNRTAPAATQLVSRRIKEIAKHVGAPLDDSERCRANIAIIFIDRPQALLDDMRRRRLEILGYYDNSEQRDALAKVTHPIQAWYMTTTKDLRGNIDIDSSKIKGIGHDIDIPCDITASTKITLSYSKAAVCALAAWRRHSRHFYQIVSPTDFRPIWPVRGRRLADYIALAGADPVHSLDICQQLPAS